MTQATERFFAGQKLYGEKKFEEVLAEFRASYTAVPSPNSRLYIARCLRRLGRNAAAHEEYGQVILEAADKAATDKKYAATQQAAAEERAEIKDKVGMIKLAMPAGVAGVTVKVGAEDIPAARWGQPIAADVGTVTVRAEAPGRAPFEKAIEVKPGQQQEIAVELSDGKTNGGGTEGGGGPDVGAKGGGNFLGPLSELPLRPISFATAGVGVAGLVLWGIFGTKAASRYEELDAKCQDRCDPFYQDDISAGRRETAAATAGLVIGVVGVVGGAAIFTLDFMNRKAMEGSAGAKTSLRVVPNPKAPFVAVGGAF